ncbi:MAG: hypothetical protein ACYC2W_10740 [Desulfurivibrionaceae bacterium]
MASIRDYLFDTAFLDRSIDYLAETLPLTITLIDSEGTPLASRKNEGCDTPASRAYPFHFSSDIGAIVCAAPNQDLLAQAEPHILYCLASLNSQLLRETELRETTEEMLQLSSQLNFLFKVAKKIIGIDDLKKCYQIILDEISQAIKADQGFIHTKGRWDEDIRVTHGMTNEEVDSAQEYLPATHDVRQHHYLHPRGRRLGALLADQGKGQPERPDGLYPHSQSPGFFRL